MKLNGVIVALARGDAGSLGAPGVTMVVRQLDDQADWRACACRVPRFEFRS
jgi:hypothetical protein